MEITTNEGGIDDVFKSTYTTIITSIQKTLGIGPIWIIYSVIDNTVSISKYNPLAGSSYIKLPKELDHPNKGLINIQNTDGNECSKWCFVRYKSERITKSDKSIAKKIGFKDMKIQVQTRDIKDFKTSMYEHT